VLHALAPAARIAHSGRSLLNHLVGTWSILSAWGASHHVRLAGLLHSVYSTEYFPVAMQSSAERDRFKQLVGPEAELLAHTFCSINRSHLRTELSRHDSVPSEVPILDRTTGHAATIGRRMAQDLALIEAANLVEHQHRIGRPPSTWMADALFLMRIADAVPAELVGGSSLTVAAEEEAAQFYRTALDSSVDTATKLLQKCILLNPCVGDARVLLAAALLANGEWEQAIARTRQGMDLLNAWTVPWETRLDIGAWSRLAHHITIAATRDGDAAAGGRLFEQCVIRLRSMRDAAPSERGTQEGVGLAV
jgi:hypothetical protein